MKTTLFLSALLCGVFLHGQVKLDSLYLQGRTHTGTFFTTVACETDSMALAVADTGTAGNFEYQWTFYSADSSGAKVQNLLTSGFTPGEINFQLINDGLDSVRQLNELFILFEIIGRDNSSGDTASLPILIKSIPQVKDSYIKTFGSLVFNQNDQLQFSTSFPGAWVTPLLVEPVIDLRHGYFDQYFLKLEEYDNTGSRLRSVPLEQSLSDTFQVAVPFSRLKGIHLGDRLLNTSDYFMGNTSREYYRFSFHYGLEGCGWDSVYTYFRVITPEEISLQELQEVDLIIFPNPAQNTFVVETADDIENFAVYDLRGKEITVGSILVSGNKLIFDARSLPSGMYLLKLQINDNWVSRQLVKS